MTEAASVARLDRKMKIYKLGGFLLVFDARKKSLSGCFYL